jgi:pimeloyl-ACP methyl ester carboxylesterase
VGRACLATDEAAALPRAPRVVFLPGAGGDREFWSPVAQHLPADWAKVLLGWPGLGDQPHDPAVSGLDDLVGLVVATLTVPSDLVAQSMGGIVAVRVAARYPERVRRLVLVATSAGFDIAGHNAEDWRADYRRTYPDAAAWITEPVADQQSMIEDIAVPTLLLWSTHDPLSPVTVGRDLARLLPQATLRVIEAPGHGFARDEPELVAPLIAEHLS